MITLTGVGGKLFSCPWDWLVLLIVPCVPFLLPPPPPLFDLGILHTVMTVYQSSGKRTCAHYVVRHNIPCGAVRLTTSSLAPAGVEWKLKKSVQKAKMIRAVRKLCLWVSKTNTRWRKQLAYRLQKSCVCLCLRACMSDAVIVTVFASTCCTGYMSVRHVPSAPPAFWTHMHKCESM